MSKPMKLFIFLSYQFVESGTSRLTLDTRLILIGPSGQVILSRPMTILKDETIIPIGPYGQVTLNRHYSKMRQEIIYIFFSNI